MNQKSDISIEFGHIYQDELFTQEHKTGIVELFKQIEHVKKNGFTYSTVVMIDDYNVDGTKNFMDQYWSFLDSKRAMPDYYVYESALAIFMDEVFAIFNNRTKKSYQSYIDKHKKIPCSLFIVMWYFYRLGLLDGSKDGILHTVKDEEKNPFFAEKLVTILPKRFMEVEMIAQKAIRKSKQKSALEQIQTIFF